jgi:hypothetical protein
MQRGGGTRVPEASGTCGEVWRRNSVLEGFDPCPSALLRARPSRYPTGAENPQRPIDWPAATPGFCAQPLRDSAFVALRNPTGPRLAGQSIKGNSILAGHPPHGGPCLRQTPPLPLWVCDLATCAFHCFAVRSPREEAAEGKGWVLGAVDHLLHLVAPEMRARERAWQDRASGATQTERQTELRAPQLHMHTQICNRYTQNYTIQSHYQLHTAYLCVCRSSRRAR